VWHKLSASKIELLNYCRRFRTRKRISLASVPWLAARARGEAQNFLGNNSSQQTCQAAIDRSHVCASFARLPRGQQWRNQVKILVSPRKSLARNMPTSKKKTLAKSITL
jgi:hypothetical protein